MEEFEKHKEESLVEEVQMSVPSTVVIKKENDVKNDKKNSKCCKWWKLNKI